MKHLILLLSALSVHWTIQAGEPFRTDINPALRYYQAFLLAPELSEADHKYLFVDEWRGRKLDEHFGELVAGYNTSFKLIRMAARAEVPCDWGIDLSEGPNAYIPGLARSKNMAQVTRYRVMWDLENGKPQEAVNDLVAAYALARNTSRDGLLISALVQCAMENIFVSIIAENFYRLSPDMLQQLVVGIEACPPRGTIQACGPAEKAGFYDWFMRKIGEVRQSTGGDEAKALAEIRRIFRDMQDTEEPNPVLAGRLEQALKGNLESFVQLIRDLEPLYARVDALMALPYSEFEQVKKFNVEVANHPNPLVPTFFSVFQKCRLKEFATEVVVSMLKAAVALQTQGAAAFNEVHDPCGAGPFAYERFAFDGVERGFKLKSAIDGMGFDLVLIFVQKDGPAFQIYGKGAGRPVSSEPGK